MAGREHPGDHFNAARSESDDDLEELRRNFKRKTSQVHVTALDEVVSVNSYFTIAVFIGVALTSVNLYVGSSSDPKCVPGVDLFKKLVVQEVIAFGCFQFSSLVAHGLKLLMVFKNSKDPSVDAASVDHRLLRLGILTAALGSATGTVFLMLSLLDFIQLRFGRLGCADPWVLRAAVPLLTLVSCGVLIFISSVVYAFLLLWHPVSLCLSKLISRLRRSIKPIIICFPVEPTSSPASEYQNQPPR